MVLLHRGNVSFLLCSDSLCLGGHGVRAVWSLLFVGCVVDQPDAPADGRGHERDFGSQWRLQRIFWRHFMLWIKHWPFFALAPLSLWKCIVCSMSDINQSRSLSNLLELATKMRGRHRREKNILLLQPHALRCSGYCMNRAPVQKAKVLMTKSKCMPWCGQLARSISL